MSAKPESTFTASIHKHLPSALHREKMHNPYRGGTWDCWYSGDYTDLWVEYKFIVLPKRSATMIDFGLSELQLQWGAKRYVEGRNLAVIVGCKEGGVILRDLEWEQPMPQIKFQMLLQPRQVIAKFIVDTTSNKKI